MLAVERAPGCSAPPVWVQFVLGGSQYALPITAVVEVVALGALRPVAIPGWAGVLTYRDGTLPLAEGAELVELTGAHRARGRGVVLRGPRALGFTVDAVPGLVTGQASPRRNPSTWPALAAGLLPTAGKPTLVLDAERLWRWLWSGLAARADGQGFELRALAPLSPSAPAWPFGEEAPRDGGMAGARVAAAASAPGAVSGPARRVPEAGMDPPLGGRVLVFRAGVEVDLAVPSEQVLEIGPLRAGRPLPGAPRQLAGLLGWRGHLVPLVDLPARLGASTPPTGRTLYLALSGRAARAVAVRVSEVLGPAQAGATLAADPVPRVPPAWVRATLELRGRPLVVIDPAALVVSSCSS